MWWACTVLGGGAYIRGGGGLIVGGLRYPNINSIKIQK
jgi:hypothetical protein